MSKITYANKVAINENAEIPNINKVTDSDMNEIKAVVNNNDDSMIIISTNLINATTYSTTETVVGTWTDNKPIYRKVWAFELSNNADLDGNLGLTNTNNFWVNEGKSFIKSPDQSLPANFYYSSSDWARTWLYKSSSFIHYRFKSPSDLYGYTLYITVEYTKTD